MVCFSMHDAEVDEWVQVALLRNQLGETSESLELLKCAEFVGPPGSGSPLAQPFSVSAAQEVPCAAAVRYRDRVSSGHGMQTALAPR